MVSGRHTVNVTSGTIFRTILILVGFWFVYVIFDVIILVFAAIIIASVIEPIANWAGRRRVPRAVTVLLVYTLFLILLSGAVTILIEPLKVQSVQLAQAIPDIVPAVYEFVGASGVLTEDGTIEALQSTVFKLGDNIANISLNVFQGTRTVFSGLFSLIFVFIIAFYLVMEKDALKKFARLVTPQKHVPYVERVLVQAQRKLGRWLIAQRALGIIIGTVVGIGLWLLGVKYALLLGIVSGLLEIIPVIGPIIAAVPGVLVAMTQSWVLALVALGFYVLVQQMENHLLIPKLMQKAVGLNPLVTIIAVLLGARLGGVIGMLMAVPFATIFSIVLEDIFAKSR